MTFLIRAFFCLSFLCSTMLHSQVVSLESGAGIGSVMKHSEVLKYNLDGSAYALYLSGRLETQDLFPWAHLYRNPIIQLESHFLKYNAEELGSSITLYPAILFPILRKNGFNLYFQLGSGITYHTKIYDRIKNPDNNAISTRFSNLTKLGFQGEIEFANNNAVSLNMGLIHSSNGAYKTPNRGINSLMLNLLYKHDIQEVTRKTPLDSIRLSSKHQWEISAVTTKRQSEQPNSSDLYFYEGAIAYRMAIGPVNYLGIGLSMALSEQDVDFLMRYEEYENRRDAIKAARRYSIFIQDELMLGNLGLTMTAGVYLFSQYRPFIVYNKLTARYYLANYSTFSPFLGVELKTHLFTAEYIALKYGVRINGKKRRGIKVKL